MGRGNARSLATVMVAAALVAPPAAWASSGGDANAGDVWVDNVGQPPGPGHEMDPHLGCQDINLWGSGLADASGQFSIDGWPPSGAKHLDYGASTWSYNQQQAGSQVIAVINVRALINQAVQNGETPLATQGYHFKLQFSQDPQKHKTFWVNCPAPAHTSSPPPTSPPPTSPPTSPPTAPPPSTPATATSPTPSPTAAPRLTTQAPAKKKPAKHKAKRHRVRRRAAPKRHRARRPPAPPFAG